jgi:hypothetical protein
MAAISLPREIMAAYANLISSRVMNDGGVAKMARGGNVKHGVKTMAAAGVLCTTITEEDGEGVLINIDIEPYCGVLDGSV